MQHSEETKSKISQSLKHFHEVRKTPSPEQKKVDSLKVGFFEGSGIEVAVRNYSKPGVKENEAHTRNTTQDNAPQENKDGLSATKS